VPATGASIGLDRLIAALEAKKKIGGELRNGPVVVTIMDKDRITDYQEMVAKLRNEGICAELFLGKGGFGKQVKYADKRNSPAVVIAGGDEFAKGEVSVKDLKLGAELAKKIEDNKKWREEQPAQVTIKQADMITHIKKILER
jgi:histidyl-tRNA synthetase